MIGYDERKEASMLLTLLRQSREKLRLFNMTDAEIEADYRKRAGKA